MLSEGTRLLPYEQYQEQARQLFDKVISRCPSFAEVRTFGIEHVAAFGERRLAWMVHNLDPQGCTNCHMPLSRV